MIRSDALRRRERRQALLTVVFTIISVLYLMPVFLVLINSLKANAFVNTETFKMPTAESFVGLKNYVKGMTFGNFAFYKVVFYSFFITITSTALILVCTSMAAWYISRVGSLVSKIVYYLCVFSMVVPFQMVMYTLARTADQAHLNTPWTIPVIYLGFGAGLAVFMFTGFVKSLPLEIEEAAAIDGVNAWQKFWKITLPLMTPAIFYVLIVSLINAFQLFPQIMIMTDGGPNGATQVMVERIYKYGFRYYRMGYAAAFSWILFAIIMVCTAIQMKGQERWVNYDS